MKLIVDDLGTYPDNETLIRIFFNDGRPPKTCIYNGEIFLEGNNIFDKNDIDKWQYMFIPPAPGLN